MVLPVREHIIPNGRFINFSDPDLALMEIISKSMGALWLAMLDLH